MMRQARLPGVLNASADMGWAEMKFRVGDAGTPSEPQFLEIPDDVQRSDACLRTHRHVLHQDEAATDVRCRIDVPSEHPPRHMRSERCREEQQDVRPQLAHGSTPSCPRRRRGRRGRRAPRSPARLARARANNSEQPPAVRTACGPARSRPERSAAVTSQARTRPISRPRAASLSPFLRWSIVDNHATASDWCLPPSGRLRHHGGRGLEQRAPIAARN